MGNVRLLMVLVLLVGCAAPVIQSSPRPKRKPKPQSPRWVYPGEWLGSYRAWDWITFQHVWWLLHRHGIELEEGEGSHGIAELHVDRELAKATRLVRQDRERIGYELSLHDDRKGSNWLRDRKWHEVVLNRAYRDVIHRDPRFSARTQLGAVLRKHIRLTRTFPLVKVVRSERHPYLDSRAKPSVGWEYEIEFMSKTGKTKEVTGQVWDEGRRVTSSYLDGW